jgi:polysaccharide export outer membrane protein
LEVGGEDNLGMRRSLLAGARSSRLNHRIGIVWIALSLLARPLSAQGVAANYVLRPFDTIHVVVFEEPDLERQVQLSQESTVTLPLIGQVALNGKTIAQAEKLIHNLYDKDYLVDPQITVTVVTYSTQAVNVLGSVDKAGEVDIPPDRPLTLLQAIAQAGGFNRLADRKHIKLSRVGADGKTTTSTINADEIIQSETSDQWVLQKSDVIFVPEKLL